MLVDFLVVVFVLVVVLVVVDGDVGDGVVFVEFVLDLVVAVSDMFLVADLEFVNKFIFLFMSVFVCPTVVLVVDVVVVVVVVVAAVVVVIEDTFSEELAMVLGDVVTKFDVTVSVMGMLAWVVECVDNVARMIVDGEVLIDCADKLAFGCLLRLSLAVFCTALLIILIVT